jgi:SagB-type dehydrogenase family enzyme
MITVSTPLPPPRTVGEVSLEEALSQRRSVREFIGDRLSDAELSQLLWAAQGMTDPGGFRTAPSAGALYPLELYAVTPAGAFHYDPDAHMLQAVMESDLRRALYSAAVEQEFVLEAPLVVVITGVYARTQGKYGAGRGKRYVHLEAGHAAQNLLLQAVALGLGAVPIGAFDDTRVQEVLGLPGEYMPLYLIALGKPR